jgi:hypothetical protein
MKSLTIVVTALLLLGEIGVADDLAKPAAKAESKELTLGKERLKECRKLFADGKEDDAINLARESLKIFVAPFPNLRHVGIGVIDAEKYRIEIHINTSDAERADPKPPITRPYSFLVYSKGKEPKLLYALDFEHGHDDGKLASAALGRMHNGHVNHGMVEITAKFAEVKKQALQIINSGIETKD